MSRQSEATKHSVNGSTVPHRQSDAIAPRCVFKGHLDWQLVIKPITDEEDYDVDSICEFEALHTRSCSQENLKQLLRAEVYAYHAANSMKRPVREGRRCWVLDYADGAQFHMDIVPAVPDAQRQRLPAGGIRPLDDLVTNSDRHHRQRTSGIIRPLMQIGAALNPKAISAGSDSAWRLNSRRAAEFWLKASRLG